MPPPLARSDHLFHMRNVTYRCTATGFSKFNRNYFMPLTPSTNAQVISDMGTFSFPMIDSGTPDGFNNLGGAISWIKSLSASVSNGLRSILRFEGAAFAASL